MIERPWDSLSLDVLRAEFRRYDRDWARDGELLVADDYDRLYLLESGEALVRSEKGETVRLRPGAFYLFPGGEIGRYYRCLKPIKLAWVHFRAELIPGISVFSFFSPPVSNPADEDDSALFHQLLQAIELNSPKDLFAAISMLSSLLAPFMPNSWCDIFPDPDQVERLKPAMLIIQQNINRPFNLKKLAQAVALHPTYFSNLFKKYLGMAPSQYHKKLRMSKAKMLLMRQRSTVAEVANACGYEDPLHFSKVFRDYTGSPPSTFHKHQGSP